jgi:glycosyltransferase involved in cell wall biosynthesis
MAKDKIRNVTISVIVPCVSRHIVFLPSLLEELKKQSRLPEEVVVSISEVDSSYYVDIENLRMQSWPFVLKFLSSEEKQSTGKNRNIAARHSSGDILLLQDADDVPHPQRVEILGYIFEHYPIDYILHQWMPGDKWRESSPSSFQNCPDNFLRYNHKEIRNKVISLKENDVTYREINHLQSIHDVINSRLFKLCEAKMQYITWGSAAITRKVYEALRWQEDYQQGEDVIYGYKVIKRFHHFFLLPMPLIKYQIENSSY